MLPAAGSDPPPVVIQESTRRPLPSLPEDHLSLEKKVAFLWQKVPSIDKWHEQLDERERNDSAGTAKALKSLALEQQMMRTELREIERRQAATDRKVDVLVAAVGEAPNDATGAPGSGMQLKLAELVVAGRTAIRLGAATSGGVIGIAWVVDHLIPILVKVFQ